MVILLCRRFVPQARSVEVKEVEFNAEFITRMMQRLEWRVVKEAADTVHHPSSTALSLTWFKLYGMCCTSAMLTAHHHCTTELQSNL